MDSTLKELIQKATINGFLSEANKKFILEKANEQGISETEVNIYIEAFLKENSANDKTNEFNVNSIDFKNIDWIDKLSYLFGFGILLSGLFPWIESHASKGFSILAGYIFGNNERNEKISMTSPVSMSLEDSMTMMFMVPRQFNKNMLPKPNQSGIEFKEEPAKTVAAIRFSGWANDTKIEKYKQNLKTALDTEGIKYSNQFYFFGYNAPYEVFNRKNEVIVELQ